MTPTTAARVAAHARRLLTARILTTYDYAVHSTMLWRLRRPGRADLAADYAAIARLSGVCRNQAIKSVMKLCAIGLLSKIRRRVRVQWGRGVMASRQIANAYVFRAPATESTGRPADTGIARLKEESPVERALASLAGAFGVPLKDATTPG